MAQLARQLMNGSIGAAVITGKTLPDGWYGKSWACQQLAEAASGELLIFTDADVSWHPGALGAVLRELERSGAVEVENRRITIKDAEILQQWTQS